MTDPFVAQILDSARYFVSVLESADTDARLDIERVVDGYLDHKRTIAKAMQRLAPRYLVLDLESLDTWKERVRIEMELIHTRSEAMLPRTYLRVRGFSTLHPMLYAYLELHEGRPISGSRMRVLTADQIHTERRVRELRDLGLSIESVEAAGENVYTLRLDQSDPERGARTQLLRNLKELTGASASVRSLVEARLAAEASACSDDRNV